MSAVCSADLHEAIDAAWATNGLNEVFRALWDPSVEAGLFPTLHDAEAGPHQPFPYCVMEVGESKPVARMSGTSLAKRELRDTPVVFRCWADRIEGDRRSPKRIAADLAEEVMKVYGGHPTVGSRKVELGNGGVLSSQYLGDVGAQGELQKYQWIVRYRFLLDVPAAVGEQ